MQKTIRVVLLLMTFAFFPTVVSSQSSIVVTSGDDEGPGTLRQALQDILPGGIIIIDVQTILLASELVVDKNISIIGGYNQPRIRSEFFAQMYYQFRIIDAEVLFNNIQFVGLDCCSEESGLLKIIGESIVSIDNSSLYCDEDCIRQSGGTFSIENSDITTACCSRGFEFTDADSVYFGNVTQRSPFPALGGRGGLIDLKASSLVIENSLMEIDVVLDLGSYARISDTRLGGNGEGSAKGSVISRGESNFEIYRSTIAGNSGLVMDSGTGIVSNSILYMTPYFGPTNVVSCISGNLKLWNSTVFGGFELPLDNPSLVGGIDIESSCDLDLYSSVVIGEPAIIDEAGTMIDGKFNLISDPNLDPFVDPELHQSLLTPLFNSPLLDAGDCKLTGSILDRNSTDRPIDLAKDNASGGDGCDIGAIEAENADTTGFKFSIKAILSGAWDGSEMSTALNPSGLIPLRQPYDGIPDRDVSQAFLDSHPEIVDWVWVALRARFNQNVLRKRQAAFITKTGDIVSTEGEPVLLSNEILGSQYHVVVGHRNHLPVMSALRIELNSEKSTSIDFSEDPDVSYATEGVAVMDLGGGKYGLWPGDLNGDNVVSYSGAQNDRVLVLEQAGGPTPFDFVNGYLSGDINLDGKVSYSGALNDRVDILSSSGGPSAFDSRQGQVPNL